MADRWLFSVTQHLSEDYRNIWKKEITFKQVSKTASKLLDYILELKIPNGELVEFRRDVVKEHTGLSYGRQVRGLHELCDLGLIQVRFYRRVREIAINNYGLISF